MDFTISDTYSYNQKDILKQTVLDFITTHKTKSILDIGAGFVETAKIYQEAVPRYLAIESQISNAKKLQEASIPVSVCTFPCEVLGAYDLVLSSHSIPEDINLYKPFILKAWESVSIGGYLMIITFKGGMQTLSKKDNEISMRADIYDKDKYDEMMHVLQTFGNPAVTTIESIEKTKDINDLVNIVSMSLDVDSIEWKDRISEKLEFFKEGDEYLFPHEHMVVVMQKD